MEILCCGLITLDKLVTTEEKKYNEYKEETRREPQLPVSASEVLVPADTPQVYLLVDLSNPFDNPDFVVSLANYDLLDLFWLDQGVGLGTPQTSQGS
jgi:hypothetical protein